MPVSLRRPLAPLFALVAVVVALVVPATADASGTNCASGSNHVCYTVYGHGAYVDHVTATLHLAGTLTNWNSGITGKMVVTLPRADACYPSSDCTHSFGVHTYKSAHLYDAHDVSFTWTFPHNSQQVYVGSACARFYLSNGSQLSATCVSVHQPAPAPCHPTTGHKCPAVAVPARRAFVLP